MVNCLVFAGLALSHLNAGFLSYYFSKVLFLETGLALLVGGALAFLGSASTGKSRELINKNHEEWSIDKLRRCEKRANKYFMIAAIWFVQSILISFVGF